MTKYIFVDVDGVLNPDYPQPGNFTVLAKPGGSGPFKLNLNTLHGKWLLQLAEDTDSTLVWGSTWVHYANEWVGSRIGLPEIDHLRLGSGDMPDVIKARAAKDYADGSRFVYFDDWKMIGTFLGACDGLHIWVDPYHGLQIEHIEEAKRFLMRPAEILPVCVVCNSVDGTHKDYCVPVIIR